jgi:hypothetical protein
MHTLIAGTPCCTTTHPHTQPTPPLTETLANRDLKKKMSPTNAKALNTMRQRIKKHNSGDEYGPLVMQYRCARVLLASACVYMRMRM